MMPSCACAMCDECARDSLIESETNTCPACKEPDNSPEDLIPWRQVRDKVRIEIFILLAPTVIFITIVWEFELDKIKIFFPG